MNNILNRIALFLTCLFFVGLSPAIAGGMPEDEQAVNHRDQVELEETKEQPLSAKDETPFLFEEPFEPFWEISGYVGYLRSPRTPIVGSSKVQWKNTDPTNIGLRATKWETTSRGWQLDYRNFQLSAEPSTTIPQGALAINLSSINAFSLSRVFAFPKQSLFDATPYVAIGGGVDYIKSEFTSINNISLSNSEFGGINFGGQIGLRRIFNKKLSGFIEASAVQHSVSLGWGSISLDTNIPVLNVNMGLAYRF